jgi:hypothetical protein
VSDLEKFLPFAGAMLDNAEWQVEQHQFAAAIVLAQVAVEMAATDAFTTLFVRRFETPVEDEVLDLVPDRSFMQKRTRTFWTWLTGSRITEPNQVWEPYRQHVQRRNGIAHGQAWGDEDSARDSVAAARAFMERMAAEL